MLSFYGYTFSTVELNYTWYQMARAEAVARMVRKAPSHFRFSAKLTRPFFATAKNEQKNWLRRASPKAAISSA